MPASRLEPLNQRAVEDILTGLIEDILKAMGRSDVAVEHVSVDIEGVLSAAFVRGLRTKRIALPLDRLVDRAQVRAAMEEALGDLTSPGPDHAASGSCGAPEARFRDKDRAHRAGAKFD